MNPAPENSSIGLTSDVIIARVDAPNSEDIQEVREFLSGGGVDVIAGPPGISQANYYVLMGTCSYVKTTLAQHPCVADKTILLLWDGAVSDIQREFPEKYIKVALLERGKLSSRIVSDIFTFFFTSKDRFLVLRNEDVSLEKGPHILQNQLNNTPTEISTSTKVDNIVQHKSPASESLQNQTPSKRKDSILTRFFSKPNAIQKKLNSVPKKFPQAAHTKLGVPIRPKNTHIFIPISRSEKALQMVLKTIFGIVLTVVLYVFMLFVSLFAIGYGAKLLADGNILWGERSIGVGTAIVKLLRSGLGVVSPGIDMLGGTSVIRTQETILYVVESLGSVGSSAVRVSQLGKSAGRLALGSLSGAKATDSSQTPAVYIDKLRSEVSFLDTKIAEVSGQTDKLVASGDFPFSIGGIKNLVSGVSANLASLRRKLESGQNMLAMYPYVAGFDSPKTFLILLQNNAELRPSGGFIGSVGKLVLNSGKVQEFTVQDVYVYDGQLKGHVDPPKPIAEILKQEHWYLRDSNWDPDFRTSGQKAQWFYEKITNEKVDGVVGVTMQLLLDILKQTGPIELTDYKDTITAENFFSKSFYYTKTDFFPGSTQKKDFLGDVANTILSKISSADEKLNAKLISVILESLEKKDIQLYFSNPELFTLSTASSWSGAWPNQTSCVNRADNKFCFYDYVGIVDANVGINKVNFFVKPEKSLDILMDENGEIKYSLVLTYHNTSVAAIGGGGAYTNYLRVYLPKDARISQIAVGGKPITTRIGEGLPRMPYAELVDGPEEYLVMAIAIDITTAADEQIAISYSRNRGVIGTKPWRYQMFVQKQAGVPEYPTAISVEYPMSWGVQNTVKNGKIGPTTTSVVANTAINRYNTSLYKDFDLDMEFVPPEAK